MKQEFLLRRKQKAETTRTRMEGKQREAELGQRQNVLRANVTAFLRCLIVLPWTKRYFVLAKLIFVFRRKIFYRNTAVTVTLHQFHHLM